MRSTEPDLVCGRKKIAEILNEETGDSLTPAGVSWLHEFGRLPIVKVDRAFLANPSALRAAVRDGFRRARRLRAQAKERELA